MRCTDANEPDARAKLEKSINVHDDDTWQHTESCTYATAPDARAKTSISMNRHGDDALKPPVRCTEGTALEGKAKPQEYEGNLIDLKARLRTSMNHHEDNEW